MKPVYNRVIIKISGEAIGKAGQDTYDMDTVSEIAERIIQLNAAGVQVGLVIGGGNIWRGRQGVSSDMDRVTADHMGMLATVINALCVRDVIERMGKGRGADGCDVEVRVMSAIEMRQVAEPYIRGRAVRHLEKGRVVIFAAGMGSPFVTTDSAAAWRAVEIAAQVVLLAKNVDYIYDNDPKLDPNAKPIYHATYREVYERDLNVTDKTALTICMENNIPIYCFELKDADNLLRVVSGEKVGTSVSADN